MFAITLVTGLASLFGCLCMALVCAGQLVELFAAARPAPPRAWEARPCPRLTPASFACAA